jgi:hypothetical protein
MDGAKWSPETLEHFASYVLAPKPQERAKALAALTDSDIVCLVEALANVLAGRVKLSRERLRALRPYAKAMRRLAPIRNLPVARRTLQQTGAGFLAPLLPVIVSVLSSLVANAVQ